MAGYEQRLEAVERRAQTLQVDVLIERLATAVKAGRIDLELEQAVNGLEPEDCTPRQVARIRDCWKRWYERFPRLSFGAVNRELAFLEQIEDPEAFQDAAVRLTKTNMSTWEPAQLKRFRDTCRAVLAQHGDQADQDTPPNRKGASDATKL